MKTQGFIWLPLIIIVIALATVSMVIYAMVTTPAATNANTPVLIVKNKNANTNTNSGTNANRILNANAAGNTNGEGVVCTMDARSCPDGSFVGRVPPNCEFAPCPNANVNSVSNSNTSTIPADWKTYSNNARGFSFQYPASWSVNLGGGINADTALVSIANPETQQVEMSVYYYATVADEIENEENHINATTVEELVANDPLITKIGQTILGDLSATDVIWGGESSYYVVLAVKNEHLYKVFFPHVVEKQDLTVVEKQILSTFRFTE